MEKRNTLGVLVFQEYRKNDLLSLKIHSLNTATIDVVRFGSLEMLDSLPFGGNDCHLNRINRRTAQRLRTNMDETADVKNGDLD